MSFRAVRPRLVGVVAAAVALVATACVIPDPDVVGEYGDGDASQTAYNILAPGQGRRATFNEVLAGIVPPHNDDWREAYDALVQGAPGLTAAGLQDFFKENSFGVRPDDIERVYSPRDGVIIIRDRTAGVPHVYGATRADVAFGAGYVHAEDRLFDADINRHIGRARLSEFLGATPGNLGVDASVRRHATYSEADLQAQLDRLVAEHGASGAQVVEDFVHSAAGFNAFIDFAAADPPGRLPAAYVALGVAPEPWTATDFVAMTVFASWAFQGGGGQLGHAAVLGAIEAAGFSDSEAREVYEDFRHANDPEAPTTTDEPFPLNADLGPVDPDAVARPDSTIPLTASAVQAFGASAGAGPEVAAATSGPAWVPDHVDGPFGPVTVRPWPGAEMSNWLAITRRLSDTGRVLMVGGPQVGYQSPQQVMETDLHGPGIHARGVDFPGLFPTMPAVGRGADYGWTGTSPTVDQADIRAVKICDPGGGPPQPDGTHYLRDGQCLPMEIITDTWQDPAGNPVEMTTERTVVGIVQERGTVDGEPVAFTFQRATEGIEAEFALAFVDIVDPDQVHNVRDMQRDFARASFAANLIAFDRKDVAYITGGATPVLAPGVDRDLPFWGDSEWDWTGLLSFDELPQEINPKKGYSTNWNNKQAPGFTSDGSGYGSVHRSQLLDAAILSRAADGEITLVELVQAAQEAATRDRRGPTVLPVMLEAVGDPADPRLDQAIALLEDWIDADTHRRDLDLDGDYEHAAAVALVDRWFGRVVEAMFEPTLGAAFDAIPLGNPFARPGAATGWASAVSKDLRTILGHPVEGPYSRIYCGNGDLASCRAALVASLDAAVASLEADYGPDPSGWDAQEELDRIDFGTGATGHYQDRSSFQQVLEFGHSKGPGHGERSGSLAILSPGYAQSVTGPVDVRIKLVPPLDPSTLEVTLYDSAGTATDVSDRFDVDRHGEATAELGAGLLTGGLNVVSATASKRGHHADGEVATVAFTWRS